MKPKNPKKPYQYALLRYVHHAAAGEFANIGMVGWLPGDETGLCYVTDRYSRFGKFFGEFEGTNYRRLVRQLANRFSVGTNQIEELPNDHGCDQLQDLMNRYIRHDAGSFQWSEVMCGIAEDPHLRFEQLVHEFIEKYIDHERERRDERAIWKDVSSHFENLSVRNDLKEEVEVVGQTDKYKFKLGWMNGTKNVLEPISLDYVTNSSVLSKAHLWTGRLLDLSRSSDDFRLTAIVSSPRRPAAWDGYEQAVRLLSQAPNVREVVEERQFDKVLKTIESEIRAHGTHGQQRLPGH